MNVAEVKTLTRGQIVYHVRHKNADGTPQRWRVSGRVRTWKRDSQRVEVPLKHGLYSHGTLYLHPAQGSGNLDEFTLYPEYTHAHGDSGR
jgi:hypothetical protein